MRTPTQYRELRRYIRTYVQVFNCFLPPANGVAGRQCFQSQASVILPVLGGGLQVTIAHDALDLTLQSPGPGSDTWWWLLKHARTICKRVVRILLECILVWLGEYFRKKITPVLLINVTKEMITKGSWATRINGVCCQLVQTLKKRRWLLREMSVQQK